MIVLPKAVHHQNAPQLREEGLQKIANKISTVDASSLEEFDSSMLAILLAWFRASPDLEIQSAPEKLRVLSKVYGLDDLFILKEA
jgi:ABC-type transporter Mla MlaB component